MGEVWLAMMLSIGAPKCEPLPQCAPTQATTLARLGSRFGTGMSATGSQQPFEYSDGYATRLAIHRWSSYAMLPLFAAQVLIGQELLRNGPAAGGWAMETHKPIALALGGLFTVSTATGVLNAMEARRDSVSS